ncbi:MAG: AraC family transcriptional regulator [Nocardioides sp.]|nr:AraC family transcriptional regulator [Nocardioides sp.]
MSHPRRQRPHDWDQASRAVADVYFPHRLRVLDGGPDPRLTLHSLDLGPVVLGQVGWGADVAIECEYPDSYEVNLPLTGHLRTRGRYGEVVSLPGHAAAFRPDHLSQISHWDATCTVVGVKLDRAWFERESERVLGSDRVALRAALPDQLVLDRGPGLGWRQLVASLTAHLRDPGLLAGSDLVRQQLAGALAAGLLLTVYPETGSVGAAAPQHVRRVVDAVHDDPARAWTAADMAELAGTSVRRLQEGFQRWLATTPSAYLVDVRLQRARADLRADGSLGVSDVAARWGFSSASRFAAAYRRRYGVPPSADR